MPEPSTPPATEAIAQTRVTTEAAEQKAPQHYPGEGVRYIVGDGVERPHTLTPYERKADDPVYRPLWVFTVDPTVPSTEGATAILNVPYEPLERGPSGAVVEVLGFDRDIPISRVDLDDPKVLIGSGLAPSTTNHQFHQQMVYAVTSSVYAAFRLALGRSIAWGFTGKLQIRPHMAEKNAFYSRVTRSLNFGYFEAGENSRLGIPPKSRIFTCLSHDVIVHELTHALVDGLRSHFLLPTGPDVLGFHEGFSDLMAILQRFTYREVLRKQIAQSHGVIEAAELLTGIAREFGFTATKTPNQPLRTAIDTKEHPLLFGESKDRYVIGSTLVSAIFEAFTTVYRRKTARFLRLATGGTGVLPEGALSPDLVDILAEEASRLAGHFLTMSIRALDYCPPVDLRLGEYLRAMITADRDLVPDDKWAYREALIAAFAKRRIYPEDVYNLSEDALLWRGPRISIPSIEKLQFGELKFAGDPSAAADREELRRQACELGDFVTGPELLSTFGLAPPGDSLPDSVVDLPVVESIRTSRRVGPDGQVIFDLIAEVMQRRRVKDPESGLTTDFYGGVTLVIDPKGNIRYTVLKRTDHEKRLRDQIAFQKASSLWCEQNGHLTMVDDVFRLLHQPDESTAI